MKQRFNVISNLIKNIKWQSVFFKYWKSLTLVFLCFTIILSTIIFATYYRSSNTKIRNTQMQSLTKTAGAFDSVFDETDRIFYTFSSNSYVDAYLTLSNTNIKSFSENAIISRSQELLNTYTDTINYIDSISLYSSGDDYILSSKESGKASEIKSAPWYDHYKKTGETNFIITYDNSSHGDMWSRGLIVTYSLSQYSNLEGLLVIDINANELTNSLNISYKNTNELIMLFGSNNELLYTNSPNLSAEVVPDKRMLERKKESYEHGDKILTKQKLSKYPYVLVSQVSKDQISQTSGAFVMLFMLSVILAIIISIILAFYCSTHLYNYIVMIIARYESADNSVCDNYKETVYVSNNIISVMDKYQRVENELTTKLSSLKKAQTLALQTQINPHFLFNTLNLINVLALKLTKKDNEVTKVVTLLSNILRTSLDTKHYVVSVENELEHLKSYLDIVLIEYEDELTVEFDISEETLKYKTVKLILQPLVENCIEHAFPTSQTQKPKITIKSYIKETHLVFEVCDNGVGMPLDKLNIIRNNLAANKIPETKHIGICNVNQRIKLIFGEAYGLTIHSDAGGTTVKLVLPANV